jgi:signal peptidase
VTGTRKRVSVARHLADLVVLVLTVAAAWFLWPAFLGGSTQMIKVGGHSMEPTYVTGDLVILDTGAAPKIGRIVVFKIHEDEAGAGLLVVHRIIGLREDGTYITQGDNNPNPDVFLTTRSDILGSPRFSIPHGAEAIGMLSSPIGLAAAVGGLCTALLWPRKRDDDAQKDADESSKDMTPEPAAAPSTVHAAAAVQHVDDADVVAEAEAWLNEQLQLMG